MTNLNDTAENAEKARHRIKKHFIITPIIVFPIILIGLLTWALFDKIADINDDDYGYYHEQSDPNIQLTACINKDNFINIRNSSHFAWTPEKFNLGTGVLFVLNMDYTYLHPKAIKHREYLRIPLTEFKNECGQSFVSGSLFVSHLVLACKEGMESLANYSRIPSYYRFLDPSKY
jgi:hypothetical protein